tara:strand:+ start:556 stop:891 length:336 start_codon:yes stop_codon:yes gene_type:complete
MCLNCNTYELGSSADLSDFYENFIVCENDGMWGMIDWSEECCVEGGSGHLIDPNIYTTGIRIVENTDIDNDGIHNEIDSDIDGDEILNNHDESPMGLEDNVIIEVIICTDN